MAKGLIIAGTHSGCGKTTVTIGVLAALKKKGMKTQSFKAGPDFIDAGLHRLITSVPARNLDLWMCSEDYVKGSFYRHAMSADVSVVEGVMGLYDGIFSTARLARVLNLPVILVVDAYGMAESAGAVMSGFRDFGAGDTKCKIVGVIFNRVGSPAHYKRLKDSVQGIEALGYLPRDMNFEIPHRHLGLFVAEEAPITQDNIERLADAVLKFIDIDAMLKLVKERLLIGPIGRIGPIKSKSKAVSSTRIALAYDKAFCFYYEDNLDLLRQAGAEIVTFSPLVDTALPAGSDSVYIGGGYPELYAETLAENKTLLNLVRRWATSGRPMYAECGGLMYLSQGIHVNDHFLPMAGVLPFETEMKNNRSRLGYREIALKNDCILGKKGDRLRGHEFHYSDIKAGSRREDRLQYKVNDGSGAGLPDEGYRFKNTLASYIHIHFGSNPGAARHFTDLQEV